MVFTDEIRTWQTDLAQQETGKTGKAEHSDSLIIMLL